MSEIKAPEKDLELILLGREGGGEHSRPQSSRSFWDRELWPVQKYAQSQWRCISVTVGNHYCFKLLSLCRRAGSPWLTRLPGLEPARVLDPCHRPEGSWALGMRMGRGDGFGILCIPQEKFWLCPWMPPIESGSGQRMLAGTTYSNIVW